MHVGLNLARYVILKKKVFPTIWPKQTNKQLLQQHQQKKIKGIMSLGLLILNRVVILGCADSQQNFKNGFSALAHRKVDQIIRRKISIVS